jgi:hypothetical protein
MCLQNPQMLAKHEMEQRTNLSRKIAMNQNCLHQLQNYCLDGISFTPGCTVICIPPAFWQQPFGPGSPGCGSRSAPSPVGVDAGLFSLQKWRRRLDA